MKPITILLIYSILSASTIFCQTPNKYEIELEKCLEKENPKYYGGLKKILQEFQEHLLSKDIVENSSYKSYAELLDKIRMDENIELDIKYNISDSLQNLAKELNYEEPNVPGIVSAVKYLNESDSKSFVFSKEVSKLIQTEKELNRSILAGIFLKVYDEKDFELPMIKLMFFRFLDPNSDSIIYTYIGRPNPK